MRRLEQELSEFCSDGAALPSFAEFKASGRVSLYNRAVRHGGLGYWAERLGVERREARHSWTEESLQNRLLELCEGLTVFPTQDELQDAGLAAAVGRMGGSVYWAERLGLPLKFPPWTHDSIRETLAPLCSGRSEWPSNAELARHGGGRLVAAIGRYGGSQHWANEFGLRITPRGRRR